MTLTPYVFFNGHAEEALNFYHQIFGGGIEMLSRYDSVPNQYPDDYQNKIMHARLIFGGITIMFSDAMPGAPIAHYHGISLAVGLEQDEEKATAIFEQLAEGGEITMPMEKQFWGALYGQVTDKFGIRWMINCDL